MSILMFPQPFDRQDSNRRVIWACDFWAERDDNGMKTSSFCLTWCFLFAGGFAVAAKETALQYQFSTDRTNVFSVTISVQSETGTEETTGKVFVATQKVNTNFARISCRTDLRPQLRRQPRWGPVGGFAPAMYGWMGNNYFPNDCEIDLTLRGPESRDGGDRVLSAPLGKLIQSIFEPLPDKGDEKETTTTVAIMDEPMWLGPAENFQNSRMIGAPYYYPGTSSRNMPGLLYLTRKSMVKFNQNGGDDGNLVRWHKRSEFESWLKVGGGPEFAATTESDFTFDRNAGLLTQIDTEGEVVSQTETSSRKAKVSFTMRRLTGDELAAALVPPAAAPPRTLSGAELDKVVQGVQSDDLETRRTAVRQLNGVTVEHPSEELVNAVAAMALDDDMSTQMGAASFLADHATTNQMPVLLKLLRSSDGSAQQNAMKALGRLEDPAAIQPLVDVLAANPNMGQMDLNRALIRFGPAAEPAVLTLFTEKNTETRRQACAILQEIGTTNSLPTLQNAAGDPDQSLSQAAADAIRHIKLRQ